MGPKRGGNGRCLFVGGGGFYKKGSERRFTSPPPFLKIREEGEGKSTSYLPLRLPRKGLFSF